MSATSSQEGPPTEVDDGTKVSCPHEATTGGGRPAGSTAARSPGERPHAFGTGKNLALVLPSATRLATSSRVGRGERILTRTIQCRAALAWRSPPRLRRCRVVRPEEAGGGEARQRIEPTASDRMRPLPNPARPSPPDRTRGRKRSSRAWPLVRGSRRLSSVSTSLSTTW